MNISVIKENCCYGCSACSAVCTRDAIKMKENAKGFYSPEVIPDLCTDCGICVRSCPADDRYKPDSQYSDTEQTYYAVKHNDDNIRFLSSSGGAFTAICEGMPCGTVIYGATYSNKLIRHIRIADGDIRSLRKSKYVQSRMDDMFNKVYEDLKSGHTVLFSGTPCQCDGLNRFLKLKHMDVAKLYMIDFVCHGTLSSRIFRDFLSYCEAKEHSEVTDHCFRYKSQGWHSYIALNKFANGKRNMDFTTQLLTSLYYTNYSFKESCYGCPYTSVKRCSDITLADFWGIQKHMPEIDDNTGCSFVMVNTKKGNELFDCLRNFAWTKKVPLDWTEQAHLYYPVARPKDNDDFWQFYWRHGFKGMAVKYLKAGSVRRFLSKIYRKFV